MPMLFSKIQGAPIFTIHATCGNLFAILIEDSTGKISGMLNEDQDFYPAKNILSFDSGIMLSERNIEDRYGKNWLSMKVESRDKKKLGKVIDFYVDDDFNYLTHFVVSKTVLGFLPKKRIISREAIFEIRNNKIIIIDDSQAKINLNIAETPSFS